MEENKNISEDDYIPINLWGKDHWSLLGYIDTIIADYGEFQVGFDARMRQNRRNFRVLSEEAPKPLRKSHTNVQMAMIMDGHYGSRLNDDTYVDNHDDWGMCSRYGS